MPKTKPKPKPKKSPTANRPKPVRGVARGRIIYLVNGATLPDGQAVDVVPRDATSAERKKDPLFNVRDLAVETGIADLAANHDHYLYGHPKVEPNG